MVAAAMFLAVLVAQAPTSPPPPPTGLIVGRVVDAATGASIAGAIVSLNGGGAPAAPGGNGPRAMTNGNGYFVFRKLATGSYSLSATRVGYVDGAYGRRKPGGLAGQVVVDGGQRISDVVIPLWRQATIAGTVSDEAGEPSIGIQVRAFQRRLAGGRYRIAPTATATTDDRGAYRFGALQPGDYLVAIVWHDISVPASVEDLTRSPAAADPKRQAASFERFTLGATNGVIGSTSSVQVGSSVRDLQTGAPTPPTPEGNAVFIYPTQFYPDMPTMARATIITLASGQQREGVDFSLKPVRTATVSGTVIGPDGPVAMTAVRLLPAADDSGVAFETSATMTGDAGEFTLLGVPPGQYTVRVARVPRPAASPSNVTMTQIQVGSSMVMTSSSAGPSTPPPVPDDPTLVADTPVVVGSRDVTGLVVSAQRGPRITGRIEFDGTRDRPAATALARVPISLDRLDAPAQMFGAAATPSGHADESGAFKTPGVAPGRYLVRAFAPSGWTLKSVTVEGRDVSETPLDLRGADVNGVVVTYTDHPTKLTGTARASDGNVDADAVVVVFPADQSAWSESGPNPRRVRSAHAARNGSYTLTGLPVGEYYVAAIHEDTTPQWQDPAALENLARSASQVRLGDGETRTLDVKTVNGGAQ